MTITEEQHLGIDPLSAPVAFRLENVSKEYKQQRRTVTPLKAVDVQIDAGEFVTIQGSTGGGKSTLLQLLGALDRPSGGHVYLGDIDLANATNAQLQSLRATEIGFVFQSFNLIPTLTAAENVDMGLEPLDLESGARDRRVAESLERVGLGDRADHRPDELSGGQQQRVAIARAIAKQPRVLLADEPTGNLDERMRDDILQVLEELNAEGLTLVVVTHDSAVAKRARRRLRLAKGQLRDVA
ncbi:ABC transporter ATP-binding protein [Gulosibacter massiliensis]|uniref:ABC transporter ATP-binding protein n=1 Tax=Gulosibacter massiliensis TaxID=2479839 RepID=UPI000F63C8C5|nr:ABC transporter ATP-binding protein [Gulosibacter massiliensis]